MAPWKTIFQYKQVLFHFHVSSSESKLQETRNTGDRMAPNRPKALTLGRLLSSLGPVLGLSKGGASAGARYHAPRGGRLLGPFRRLGGSELPWSSLSSMLRTFIQHHRVPELVKGSGCLTEVTVGERKGSWPPTKPHSLGLWVTSGPIPRPPMPFTRLGIGSNPPSSDPTRTAVNARAGRGK